jgi:hypothetical protein
MEHILINKNVLKEKLEKFELSDIPNLNEKRTILNNWITEIEDKGIETIKEEALQGLFLGEIFGTVLNYTSRIGNTEWTLEHEQKTKVDSKKADGALGFFESELKDIHAVIELKDGKTNLDLKQNRKDDKRTPIEQAFDYATKSGKNCKWVIVSNFKEIRLYNYVNTRMEEYHLFDIAELKNEDKFKEFYYLLNFENLISKTGDSKTEKLCSETVTHQKDITKKFYTEYKNIRLNLFETLKSENPEKEEIFLLEKTQKLLDRFLFVYFAEDKGILPANIIHLVDDEAKKGGMFRLSRWELFKRLFDCIDIGCKDNGIFAYNGGLFRKDPELDNLTIPENIFEELVKISDYDFEGDLNVNILGHIFEQSISDLEEIKASVNGEEFDKSQGKRKKDGVFYTPEYITRYIVEQAVGGWLEDRKKEIGIELFYDITPEDLKKDRMKTGKGIELKKNSKSHKSIEAWKQYKEILRNIKILDPACGSGAFLIQALNYLVEEGNQVNKIISYLQGGTTALFNLKADILRNNLYGVDLNPESVEITKLSLWLNSVEKGEKLTALDNNIKCGNSLIDDIDVAGDKAFRWEEEFKEILKNGGFDIVIGNPPYVRQERIKELKPTLEKIYETYTGVADLFVYFYELGYKLLKENGKLGFITSNKWMRTNYGEKLRNLLKEKTKIEEIIDFGGTKIFQDAGVDSNILIFKKSDERGEFKALDFGKLENFENVILAINENSFNLNQSTLDKSIFSLSNPIEYNLKKKIEEKGAILKDWDININYGIKTGFNEAFVIDGKTRNELIAKDPKSAEIIKPLLRGRDINKYSYDFADLWLIGTFPSKKININEYVGIKEYLESFGKRLEQSGEKGCRKKTGNQWFETQDQISYWEDFEKEKLIYKDISESLTFCYDDSGHYMNNTVYFMNTGDKYLLSLLNSKLITWYYSQISSQLGSKALRAFSIYLEQLPIPKISKEQQTPFIEKADLMLNLNKEFQKKKQAFFKILKVSLNLNEISKKLDTFNEIEFTDIVKELKKQKITIPKKDIPEYSNIFEEYKKELNNLQAEINKTDLEIDKMVFDLYELTEEERKLVLNG